ncbi:hypothetical protein G7075_14905 [Phycicoccus sp. HDW14]|uniref:hypothetical protein n=1 Tax=Phycicoccus sp. HDW14 TaxID=2714941 RepID=UPI00140E67AC|nr:hypothetical protein [Phycicoccus sp. HDW14]QIM22128.1 hypothetical protein G7075_14905 [Phycicoccus sp. HDW14]
MTARTVGAVAAVVSAAIHLWLWVDGVKEQGVVGALFLVNVVAGVAIAVVLLRSSSWLPLLLLGGFGASTLGAFVIASTVGLFGIHTTWSGVAVWGATVSEVACVVTALLAASREGFLPRGGVHHGQRAGSAG